MAIKNVVFDFGGVLFDWNPRYYYKDMIKDEEKLDFFIKNVITSTWNGQMDRGRTFAECTKELIALNPEFEHEISVYKDGWETMIKGEIPNGVKIFDAVKNSGKFKMYGLTNWSAETFPVIFNKYKRLQDLEGIVVSGEEKMVKPEKGIYLILLERYNLKPEECLFIDDNKINVESGESRGMKGVVFKNDEATVEEVAKLLEISI